MVRPPPRPPPPSPSHNDARRRRRRPAAAWVPNAAAGLCQHAEPSCWFRSTVRWACLVGRMEPPRRQQAGARTKRVSKTRLPHASWRPGRGTPAPPPALAQATEDDALIELHIAESIRGKKNEIASCTL